MGLRTSLEDKSLHPTELIAVAQKLEARCAKTPLRRAVIEFHQFDKVSKQRIRDVFMSRPGRGEVAGCYDL